MMAQLAILLAGFSIFTALLLALASVGSHAVPGQDSISRISGLVLLSASPHCRSCTRCIFRIGSKCSSLRPT